MIVKVFNYLFCLLGLTIPIMAQNVQKDKIKYNYDVNTGVLKNIRFINDKSGQIIKTFDIVSNNPYNNLQYPIIKKTEEGLIEYDLSKAKLSEFIMPNSNNEKESSSLQKLSHAITQYSVYYKGDDLYNNTKDYTAISYSLLIINEEGKTISAQSKVFIFNSQGDIIRSINNIDVDSRDIVITKDGKYIGFIYGGIIDHNLESILDEGYRIYEVSTGQQIIDNKKEKGYELSSPLQVDDVIILILNDSMNGKKFIIYDLNKRKAYSRIYSKQELSMIKNILKDGFIILSPNGTERKDLYEVGFQKQVL